MIAKSPRIIVLEFKIIAVNDIRGAVDVNHIVTDPFINKSEINKHMTVVIEKKQVMSEIVMNFSTGGFARTK